MKEKIAAVDVWSQFAESRGGTFIESPHSSPSVMHIAVPGVVRYSHEGFEVVFDTVATPGSNNQAPRPSTRFRTLFTNKEGFRFKIYRELDDIFMKGLKFLRLMKDVEIGQPDFDAQFVMRGTDDQRVVEMNIAGAPPKLELTD